MRRKTSMEKQADPIAPRRGNGVTEYTFRLLGRIKPYVRMTQRGKWVDAQAKEYLASKQHLAWQMPEQMQDNEWELVARGVPLGAVMVIQPALHNCDLDNLAKAILDAARGIVFEHDRWVDAVIAVRYDSGDDQAYVTIFRLAGDAE